MHGFHGRLLYIDLSSGQTSWRDLEESRLRAEAARQIKDDTFLAAGR